MTPAVPEINGGVGTSFQGTAAYLLHDVGAQTNERVAWVETRNLASHDPEIAWRLMAATAMNADRLKRAHHEREQAGLPPEEQKAYRASKPARNHVFHYALSWHPDEQMELSREEMMRAANASIRELGGDHLQAMVVCHDDRAHKHVHVMLSRIDPDTGRVVPVDGNAQRHLSRFALKYERERGVTLCPQREVHAEMRKRGIPYVAEKRVPRLIYEKMREAEPEARTNPERAAALKETERARDIALSKSGRDMDARHRQQWDKLGRDHTWRKALINSQSDEAKAQARLQISKAAEPEWSALLARHRKEADQLKANERSMIGRLRNTASAVKSIWSGRTQDAPARNLIKDAFGAISREGGRRAAIDKQQSRERDKLAADIRKKLVTANKALEDERRRAIADNFERYKRDRADTMLKQSVDRAAQRSRWATRDAERADIWRGFRQGEQTRQAHRDAADPTIDKERSRGDGKKARPTRTRRRSRS